MNIGNVIKTCRVKRRLSQAALARRAKLSVSYISMIENNRRDPTLSKVKKIAKALSVPIEILFFLGADKGEISGIDKKLAKQLATTALKLIDEIY